MLPTPIPTHTLLSCGSRPKHGYLPCAAGLILLLLVWLRLAGRLPADAQDKKPGDFPRAWHDGSGGTQSHRGEAWFFFPYDHIKRQKDDISGEWTSGNAAEDRLMITAQGPPGRFDLLCITGGGNGDCDPTNKGKKGGAWHAATLVVRQDGFVSIEYDNTVQTNGTFNPTFFKVTWHDGSSWRRVGRCGCSCHPRSDTGCNKMVCSGGALSDEWERQIIVDKPWIVYVHGGTYNPQYHSLYNRFNPSFHCITPTFLIDYPVPTRRLSVLQQYQRWLRLPLVPCGQGCRYGRSCCGLSVCFAVSRRYTRHSASMSVAHSERSFGYLSLRRLIRWHDRCRDSALDCASSFGQQFVERQHLGCGDVLRVVGLYCILPDV